MNALCKVPPRNISWNGPPVSALAFTTVPTYDVYPPFRLDSIFRAIYSYVHTRPCDASRLLWRTACGSVTSTDVAEELEKPPQRVKLKVEPQIEAQCRTQPDPPAGQKELV
jgi:hypothetical protein